MPCIISLFSRALLNILDQHGGEALIETEGIDRNGEFKAHADDLTMCYSVVSQGVNSSVLLLIVVIKLSTCFLQGKEFKNPRKMVFSFSCSTPGNLASSS